MFSFSFSLCFGFCLWSFGFLAFGCLGVGCCSRNASHFGPGLARSISAAGLAHQAHLHPRLAQAAAQHQHRHLQGYGCSQCVLRQQDQIPLFQQISWYTMRIMQTIILCRIVLRCTIAQCSIQVQILEFLQGSARARNNSNFRSSFVSCLGLGLFLLGLLGLFGPLLFGFLFLSF